MEKDCRQIFLKILEGNNKNDILDYEESNDP